jgi:hypothetical protein
VKFINTNTNKKFREVTIGNNTLYVYGYINYIDNDLFTKLDKGIVPINLKGQFAFVYITPTKWIAVVDHLCTTQLFYSNNHISPNLKDVKDNTKYLNEDQMCKSQLAILKEYTVGDVTPWKEIKRIDYQHYVEDGKAYEYANILHEPTIDYDPEYAYNLYCGVAKNMNLKDPTLLFSAGKDSAFIAMLLKEVGYNPKLINITSKNNKHNADKILAQRYRDEMDWDIENYEIEYSGPTTNEDTELFSSNYWKDNTHPPKRHAVEQYTGHKLTGEVALWSGESRKIFNYLVNNQGKVNIKDTIGIYLNLASSIQANSKPFSCSPEFLGKLIHTEGYEFIYEYYYNIITNIDKPDMYSHYIWSSRSYSSHRIYTQSQDPTNQWVNIYSDYDIFNMNTNMSIGTMVNRPIDNIRKFPLWQVGKMFKEWSDISWDAPVVGMGIPDRGKFINERL